MSWKGHDQCVAGVLSVSSELIIAEEWEKMNRMLYSFSKTLSKENWVVLAKTVN